MSCYFRHMKEIFDEAGVEVSPATKKKVDRAIHEIVGTSYKDCSATWRTLKQEYLADPGKRRELVRKLRASLG